jgi:hypothetical protein
MVGMDHSGSDENGINLHGGNWRSHRIVANCVPSVFIQ